MQFKNATQAFEYFYDLILDKGILLQNTKTIYNVGFYIQNPLDMNITTSWRKWKPSYAEKEWEWYLSGNPSAMEIAKDAKIWYNMMDERGHVNSNYGYQWKRGEQLNKVIEILKKDPQTRKASISLYDGKEIDHYKHDTICTYAISFQINPITQKLDMTVMMRSNDLVLGFCNDKYCFAKLQQLVSQELNVEVGTYFHFVVNLHIYERHYNLKEKNS